MEGAATVKNAIAVKRDGSRARRHSAPLAAPVAAPLKNLPPVTVPGWIKKRPATLKNVATRAITPKMKAAIQRAKASRARAAVKRLPAQPYLDEVIVLGERVRLNEIGISASILEREGSSSELALFTPSYFPSEADYSKITQAKTVFSKVFGPDSKFGVENPIPPCEVSEFNLLKEGLQNRLYILRNALPSNSEDIISMEVRNNYERAEQFNAVIQAIESNESICTNYELNGTGAPIGIKGYGKPITREERVRIQNLIRQFSFLVLQSIHKVNGYEDMIGDITPEFLINSLEQQQITKEDMDGYIAEYTEEANSEIPDLIAQTLEATGAQDDVYALMLESELLNLIAYVKTSVTDNLTDAQLKMKFTGFAKSIESDPVRDQVVAIMKWILAEYSLHKTIISQNIDTINLNRSMTDNLHAAVSERASTIRDLESKVAQSNAQLSQAGEKIGQLTSELAKSSQDTISNESAIVKGNRELAEQLAIRAGERDVLMAEINALKASTAAALKKANDAKGTVGVLGSALDNAANPQTIPLLKTIEKIAADGGKTSDLCGIGQPFEELCKKFNDHIHNPTNPAETISDVCYLNYFVSFFMKKIFTKNTKLYNIADKLVSDYLKTNTNSIDAAIEEISNLLEAVEKPSVKAAGFYLINESKSVLLDSIYRLTTIEFNAATKNAFMRTFSSYLKKNIYYNPSGFIIKPRTPAPTTIFKLSGDEFKATSEPAPQELFNQISLPYSTLFVIYILFAKNYLIMKNPTDCPIPKFFTNPMRSLEGRKVRIASTVPKAVLNNPV